MVDDDEVFLRTEKGNAELATAGGALPPKLRRCLGHVDGARRAADFAPLFRPGESGAVLDELRAAGYIASAAR